MRLRVLFFGMLRDHFGPSEELTQFPGTTVEQLLQYYRVVSPDLGRIWSSVAIAVNQSYVSVDHAVADEDEVAFLPPVSGGISETRCK